MPSQPVDTLASRFVRAEHFASGVAYISLSLGYLSGVLLASHLTLGGFLAFTGVQLVYAGVLTLLVRGVWASSRFSLALYALALSLLSLASGLLGSIGINWDWILYLVTVVLYFSLLSLGVAVVSSLLLYGVMLLNLAFLNNWNFNVSLLANADSILVALCFVGAFSFVMTLHRAQRERAERLLREVEQSRSALEEAHTQLRRYAEQVEELAVARERTRMAREIHDSLGHYLTILNVQLETISKLVERDPSRLAAEVAEARQVAAQSMQEVRNAVAAMRPISIATLSLPQALTQLGNDFKRAAPETDLTLDLEADLPPLAPDMQMTLYRAAQEALTNVRKHAHASKVLVRLRYEEGWLELLVLDNGCGPAAPKAEGFGLIGLGERVKLLGGEVTHGPAAPSGYRVTVRVRAASVEPLKTPASLETLEGAAG